MEVKLKATVGIYEIPSYHMNGTIALHLIIHRALGMNLSCLYVKV
jgi:hypothetical protein